MDNIIFSKLTVVILNDKNTLDYWGIQLDQLIFLFVYFSYISPFLSPLFKSFQIYPSTLSFKLIASFFNQLLLHTYMHLYICIHRYIVTYISKYNLLSPYNITCMYVLGVDLFIAGQPIGGSFTGSHISISQIYLVAYSSFYRLIGLRPHEVFSHCVWYVCWFPFCPAHVWLLRLM